jgi:hypothetical protein
MRWFTSVKSAAVAIPAVLVYAPIAYACPLCFASSSPGVLRAYLVSAFFMIALAWAVIAAIWLYAARIYSEKTERGEPAKSADAVPSIEGQLKVTLRSPAIGTVRNHL